MIKSEGREKVRGASNRRKSRTDGSRVFVCMKFMGLEKEGAKDVLEV